MRLARPIFAMLAALAAGCGSAAPADSTAAQPPVAPAAAAEPAPAPAPEPAPAAPPLPDTRAGQKLAWVLEVIGERQGKVEVAELEAQFHERFLEQVPAAALVQAMQQLAAQSLTLSEVGQGSDTEQRAVLENEHMALQVIISLDADTGRIVGLLFRPAPKKDDSPPAKSFDEALARLEALPGEAGALVAELKGDRCVPLHQLAADRHFAIGSTFKLYVLLAVADAVAAGRLSWDQAIAIRDDWKSLPSGVTQNDAAGTERTVRELADKMIAISDNTATDHLLYTVGRKRVEAALRAAGHSEPARNQPFVSTRELFLLKISLAADQVQRYLGFGRKQRRRYLDRALAGKMPKMADAAGWDAPRHIDRLEWFASAEDLCAAMATLRARSQTPALAPVLDILAQNPGLPDTGERWAYVGHKGGSEPGVLNLSWLLRRADGRWFAIVVSVNDASAAVDDGQVLGVAESLFSLLAKGPR